MMELLFYLIKVFICSGILFLYYFFALRNRIFHQWNRFYLLAAVVVSLLAPLVQTTIYQYREEAVTKTVQILRVVESANNYLDEVTIGSDQAAAPLAWLYLLYGIMSMVILVFFLRSLLQVVHLLRSHMVRAIDNYYFVNTRVAGTPFSFFRYIFWNEEIDINSSAGRQIFEHELVHVQEQHSLDKIFMQLVIVFFWCNPFFWLIRKELKMIHEFIADKKSVGHHGEAAFASMVLQAAYPTQYNQLTNQYFQTSIKRRIMMLKKIQSRGWNYLTRILALPIIVLTVCAFTIRTKTVLRIASTEKPITVIIDAGHGQVNGKHSGAQYNDVYEDVINLAIAKKIQEINSNTNVHIILTRTNEENVELRKRVEIGAANKADLFISLHVNAQMKNSNSNEPDVQAAGVEVIIPKTGHAYDRANILLGSALVNELKELYPTDNDLKTKKVNTYVLDRNTCPSVLVEFGYITNPQDRAFMTSAANQQKIAETVLTAIEKYAAAVENPEEVMDTVPVKKDIVSLNINKQENKITVEYANGQSETMSIDEARKRDLVKTDEKQNVISFPRQEPLYVVDGKIYEGDMNKIEPQSIESIDILKGDAATSKYGEKGRNGAVEITLKKLIGVPASTSNKNTMRTD